MALLLALLAVAAAAAESPVLIERIGSLDHAGKAWECRLFSNHPELRGKEEYLRGLIDAADRDPIRKASHIAARVPSVEYDAIEPTRGHKGKRSLRKVALLRDHQTRDERMGAQAQELISLTKRLCQENRQ